MRCIRLPTLVLTLTVAQAAARGAHAQVAAHRAIRATVDVGGAALQQDGVSGAAALVSADVRLLGERDALAFVALGAAGTNASGSLQSMVTGSVFAPARQFFRWELTGTTSAFAESGDVPVFGAQGFAREYAGTPAHAVYVGAGGGPSLSGGVSWPTSIGEGGGWWRVSNDVVSANITRTRTTVGFVTSYANGVALHHDERIDLTDLGAGWTGKHGPATLSATAGSRAWLGRWERWGSASAVVTMNWRTALVASAGRALEDVARGVPATRYASLSLRMTLGMQRPAAPPRVDRIAGPTISVSRTSDSTCVITVRASSAAAVELMADFTEWEPLALTRVGDVWQLSRAIEPGPHRVALRVDGGEWRAPANLPRVTTDAGGDIGLMTVP